MRTRLILGVAVAVAVAVAIAIAAVVMTRPDNGTAPVGPGPEPEPVTPSEETRISADEAPADAEFADTIEAARGRRVRTLTEVLAEDVPRAEAGDAEAAFRVFLGIDRCRRMIADFPTSDAIADRFRQTAGGVPDERRDRILENLVRMHDDCVAADPVWYESGLDWLTQAADSGLVRAQLAWWRRADDYLDLASGDDETRRWYRNQSDRYIEAARDSGNLWAMRQIIERDASSDPVNAYAHAALAFRVADERVRADHGTGTSTRRQRILQHQQVESQTRLGELAGSLSGAQIAEAQARADRLYERCCGP